MQFKKSQIQKIKQQCLSFKESNFKIDFNSTIIVSSDVAKQISQISHRRKTACCIQPLAIVTFVSSPNQFTSIKNKYTMFYTSVVRARFLIKVNI